MLSVYLDIVHKCWNLDGSQAVINEAIKQHYDDWDTKFYRIKVIDAVDRHNPVPPWPESWVRTAETQRNNTDYEYLISLVSDFVRKGFNRKKDLISDTP